MSTEADVSSELEFTGERFTPDCVREIWYEHMHRYALAARLCQGRHVLDAACGEGYGSALMAKHGAATVAGVDLSEDAVAHARQRYSGIAGLDFEVGDCTRLPFPEDSFDLVVSFETLEHLENQDGMLAEFRRVLAADGCLILSSPDKAVYTDQHGNDNAFHVRELYRDELEALIARHFPACRLLGQRLQFHSLIWSLEGLASPALQRWSDGELHDLTGVAREPMYYIAVCAAEVSALPDMPADLWLFDDDDESVYDHYTGEIRKNMAAGGIIAERDKVIAEQDETIAELQRRIADHEREATAEGGRDVEPAGAVATTAIVVNYNAGALLTDCVRALVDGNGVADVRVVDNASTDGSADSLADAFADHPAVRLLRAGENRGFAAAVNAEAIDVTAANILVINPDCRLDDGALARLEAALDGHPEAALAAPWVRDANGRPEPASWRRFPDAWRSLMQLSGLARLTRTGVSVDPRQWPGETAPAEAVSGACMLLRVNAFRELGGFDEGYGLHCEDLDLMYRLHQAGRACMFVPAAGAVHAKGVSSASRPLWVHRQKHLGMQRFFRKFQADAMAPPARWMVIAGIWAHWAVTWPLAALRR